MNTNKIAVIGRGQEEFMECLDGQYKKPLSGTTGNEAMIAFLLMASMSADRFGGGPFRPGKGPTPNKYSPHQGNKEREKRLKRLAKGENR